MDPQVRPMIELDRVTLYGTRGSIVHDVTLRLPRGGFGVLFGPTGGGKTTLLRLAHFDRRPDVGQVSIGSFNSDRVTVDLLPEIRRRIGMVFQDYKLLPDRSAFENVALPLTIGGMSPRAVTRRATDLLQQVGLAAKRVMRPTMMSGGEQQRLGIARALAYDPQVLLADEPTGNLDRSTAREIMALIRRIHHRGTTILLATHDLDLVKGYGYTRWHVEQGHVTESDPI
jgi:cell division transport system ATP-binding protein